MSEATHKAALCKLLRAGLPGTGKVFRHEDQFCGGMPDISISYRGRTVWVEVKLDRPGRRSKTTELQTKTLRELCGLLLTFEDHRDGRFSAQIQTANEINVIFVPSKRKKAIYREVSANLLGRVGL